MTYYYYYYTTTTMSWRGWSNAESTPTQNSTLILKKDNKLCSTTTVIARSSIITRMIRQDRSMQYYCSYSYGTTTVIARSSIKTCMIRQDPSKPLSSLSTRLCLNQHCLNQHSSAQYGGHEEKAIKNYPHIQNKIKSSTKIKSWQRYKSCTKIKVLYKEKSLVQTLISLSTLLRTPLMNNCSSTTWITAVLLHNHHQLEHIALYPGTGFRV